MRRNQDLSGWAQAVGALVALAIAIAVPAYQRHVQNLDARRHQARLNLMLASSVSLLLGDGRNFLNGILTLRGVPRVACRNDTLVGDILERVRSLEAREVSHARILALYELRGSITITNDQLHRHGHDPYPLVPSELDQVRSKVQSLDERLAEAEYDSELALFRCRALDVTGPLRPITYWALSAFVFFCHRNLSWKHRLFGNK